MKRLDVMLSEKGLAKSRQKAKEMILENRVLINGKAVCKPSVLISEDEIIEIKSPEEEYISRGGLKLSKAIKIFNISVEGSNCMDVGASTGGFTDCMLKNGCKEVYAIDVGKNQLADKLRNDNRVRNLEGINVRYINKSLISSKIDFFSVDVSFISLSLILPKIYEIVEKNARGVCLIKPQFEAGKNNVGKKGVVKDRKVHFEVIDKICKLCVDIGFKVLGLSYSPIKGPEGNIEYLLYIEKSDLVCIDSSVNIKKVVEESHKKLNY